MSEDDKKPGWFVKIQGLKRLFQSNDLGLKLAIGFIAFLGLFLFLHFKEVRVDFLELNTIANRYVVGQVDFKFPDQEQTIIQCEKLLNSVGAIYKLETDQLSELTKNFQMHLMNDKKWREEHYNETHEPFYKAVSSVHNILSDLRFTDARTTNLMGREKLIPKYYFVVCPLQEDTIQTLPEEYWRNIKQLLSKQLRQQVFDEQYISYIMNFLGDIKWKLAIAESSQADLKEALRANVPQQYTLLKAGSKIISQGEKVTPRHLEMMQAMKHKMSNNRNLFSFVTILGSLIESLVLIVLCVIYLYMDQKKVFYSLQKLSLLTCIFILSLSFAKILEYTITQSFTHLIELIRFPIIAPFVALLVAILLNVRLALFVSGFLTIIYALGLSFQINSFLLCNIVASLVVVLTTRHLHRRTEVFAVCAKVFISLIPIFFAVNFLSNVIWDKKIIIDISSGVIFMVVIAILVVGLLPILESLFNVMTDITLMEYMDPYNELLRRLTIEIPGTYQHSLVLGNLAELAAQSIGANGLFCRVATLYHDIGKLNNTHYFAENQQGGANIHQMLTPLESAQVIVSHVTDGVNLAKKYRLPQSFIDIIEQHHGTTLVYYFYHKELELKGGDKKTVDEKAFRYPGPKPHTKESAIIMIADAAEAASRSLEDKNLESITNLIDKVVKDKAEDGQFDECKLTFEELGKVKHSIVMTLLSSSHHRVKYPEKK